MDAFENDPEMEKELLDEVMALAKGGMANDLRKRYGKEEPPELEEMPEDPEIPGVEASEQPGEEPMLEGGEEQGDGLDEQKLRALLASLKASGGPAV